MGYADKIIAIWGVTRNSSEDPVHCARAAFTGHLHVEYVHLDGKKVTFKSTCRNPYTLYSQPETFRELLMRMRTYEVGGAASELVTAS